MSEVRHKKVEDLRFASVKKFFLLRFNKSTFSIVIVSLVGVAFFPLISLLFVYMSNEREKDVINVVAKVTICNTQN